MNIQDKLSKLRTTNQDKYNLLFQWTKQSNISLAEFVALINEIKAIEKREWDIDGD